MSSSGDHNDLRLIYNNTKKKMIIWEKFTLFYSFVLMIDFLWMPLMMSSSDCL